MKNSLILLFLLCSIYAHGQWCSKPNPNFCPGNFFQNGDFETVTGNPNTAEDQDINLATGWQKIWASSVSYADLHCTNGTKSTGLPPTPNSGVYAGMWIRNQNVTNTTSHSHREGMYNRLATPIAKNTGFYSFNFKIAWAGKIFSSQIPPLPVSIGIYGVYNLSNIPSSSPIGHNANPTNLNLWPAASGVVVVLLGTVLTPNNLTSTWVPQTVTFNSNLLPPNGITHIMITADDIPRPKEDRNVYINFDEFCLQKTTPPISFDPCCPPMNTDLMATLFKFTPTGGVNDPYKVEFTPTTFFSSSSQAYCDYIHTLYPNIGRLTFSWELRKADCNPCKIHYSESVGQNSTIYNWFTPNGNEVLNSNTNFFNELLNVNECYGIHVGIFTEPNSEAFKVDCSNNTYFCFRIQVINGKRKVTISDGKKILSEYFLK